MTPAEELDMYLKEGGRVFWENFRMIMRDQSQGGRTPGLSLPSKQTTRQFYENTDPNYWQTLRTVDPKEAQSQIQQWKQVQ